MNVSPVRSANSVGLVDVIDRILDKGLVLNADIQVSLVGVELLGVKVRAALASFETAARYGLEFPGGTRSEAPGWRAALAGQEECPACGKRSAREELLEQGCPWCGWRSARGLRAVSSRRKAEGWEEGSGSPWEAEPAGLVPASVITAFVSRSDAEGGAP